MTVSKAKLIPYAIAVGVIAFVCFLQTLRHWSGPDGPMAGALRATEELELKTFDWRARRAVERQPPCATNLGFVFIGDDDIKRVAEGMNGELDYRYGLYWPRDVYARLVDELTAQGARWIAFDVLFGELRHDHLPIQIQSNAPPVLPDEFFADRVRAAGNVSLAASSDLMPHRLFRDAAARLGDISTDRDTDGVLRRARAFQDKRIYHPVIERLAQAYDFKLDQAKVTPGKELVLVREKERLAIPLQTNNFFDITEFRSHFPTEKVMRGLSSSGLAYRDVRIWHTGILMAASVIGLDLAKAQVDLAVGQIFLPGTNRVSRTLTVDARGFFPVDWSIRPTDPRLKRESISSLLRNEKLRRDGHKDKIEEQWRNQVLVIGSIATGNDLTDKGATPLESDAFLVGKHWNVANSVIMDRFITRSPLWIELLAVLVMGALAAGLTWKMQAPWSSLGVVAIIGFYLFIAHHVYVEHRYWIPIVMPVAGAMLLNHVALQTYNIVFEQRDKRRVTGVFAKLVSPNVVTQLLQRDVIRLEGKREKITVFFADVRGFTKLTDVNQTRAENYVRTHGLTGAAAEAHFDKNAKDTLDTVNLYLAAIADQIKKHNGTLDKYIGDCVMAFWGAPTPNEKHAVACVRAAIDAQIAMHLLNVERQAQNRARAEENQRRAAAGQELLEELPLLALGTGINSGTAIVGMMGSEAHIINYTVFGREVNLASRLEGVSGHSRIIIGEATFRQLEEHDMELGALCVEQEPVTPKGFSQAVRIWEVPWKSFLPPGTPELTKAEPAPAKTEKPAGAT